MATVELQPVKKPEPSNSTPSRPSTQSGYRFGQLSKSSFFARHNPHPHRCVHIKGLLGLPIPVVVDDCDDSSYETHLCFPPNGHNDEKLASQRLLLPVNAIHLNSHKHPLDTVNGLQYFTNLRNYSFKEKAVPRLGLVPVTESWREQLRSLTDQTFHPEQPVAPAPAADGRGDMNLRREATYPDPARQQQPEQSQTARPMYSRQTGRLIPPPSRAMSRRPLRSSRRSTPAHVLSNYEHISAAPDLESAVFSMLCQILQTEDFNAVQAWLVSASDREKALVMDVIRSAVANKAAYYEADPTGEVFQPTNIREDLHLPPIAEDPDRPKRVDRLVIEDAESSESHLHGHHHEQAQCQPEEQPQALAEKKLEAKPVAGAKTSRQEKEPKQKEQQQQQQKPAKAAAGAKGGKNSDKKAKTGAKLKYSKREPALAKPGGKSKEVWRPQDSYAA
uniref:Similar to n=1 Tax=Macrostomum lignano TaxID=282301 RepID=A0A1I8H186_9PLAT